MPLPDPPTSPAELQRRAAYRLGFGDAVRQARQAAGISQEQLAEQAEISRPTIARIENGTHSTTLDRLWAVAAVLSVPAAEIISRADAAASIHLKKIRRGDATVQDSAPLHHLGDRHQGP